MKASVFAIPLLFLVACGSGAKTSATPEAPAAPDPAVSAPAASSSEKAEPQTTEPAKEPEATCEKDSDCTIFTDCCSCRAISAKAPMPASCEGICGESKCEVKGKTIGDVACVAGHCKLK